jgi:hypothetical protein
MNWAECQDHNQSKRRIKLASTISTQAASARARPGTPNCVRQAIWRKASVEHSAAIQSAQQIRSIWIALRHGLDNFPYAHNRLNTVVLSTLREATQNHGINHGTTVFPASRGMSSILMPTQPLQAFYTGKLPHISSDQSRLIAHSSGGNQ